MSRAYYKSTFIGTDNPSSQHRFMRTIREYFVLIERNRAYLRKWMSWAAYEGSLEETKAYMKQTLLQFANNEGLQTGIRYQNRLVGSIDYPHLDWADCKVEIGYWIEASMQGKGLVTKICQVLVTSAFDQYHLNKVEIHCVTREYAPPISPRAVGVHSRGDHSDQTRAEQSTTAPLSRALS